MSVSLRLALNHEDYKSCCRASWQWGLIIFIQLEEQVNYTTSDPGLAHERPETSEGHHSAAGLLCFGCTVCAQNDFDHYNEVLLLPERPVNTNW